MIEKPYFLGTNGIGVRLKVFASTSNIFFSISLHQGTLSCSYILKFTYYMLSIVNEVDPLIFCCVCFICDTNISFSNISHSLSQCLSSQGCSFKPCHHNLNNFLLGLQLILVLDL